MSENFKKGFFEVLENLHHRTGFDFTQYKKNTLERRVGVRMQRLGIPDYEGYAAYMREHPEESQELVGTLAINVTELFRNPELFSALRDKVVPTIVELKKRKKHRIIRVWSCGCSEGDEAFSVAILLKEALGGELNNFIFTVIATDIDAGAIRKARNKIYTEDQISAIGAKIVEKYFVRIEGGFKLKEDIKGSVRFRQHDVTKNAPFRYNDIILCRNVMIYFNRELQEETMLKFYECLNPGGFFILGMCETLAGSAAKKYRNFDSSLRIYARPLEDNILFPEMTGKLPQESIDLIVKGLLPGGER
jgi:chemotaxis protein methyltransferase CheR